MKFKMILLLTGLLSTYALATCNKQEIMKLIDKGFSKTEINSICDIQAKSTAKPKPKSKWITPSNSTCRAKGGRLYKGICEAKWQQAKNICSASGGRLPTRDELIQIIVACGGVIANYEIDGNSRWNEKTKENQEDPNYQNCYKQKGFPSTNDYWSSLSYIPDTKNACFVNFKMGGTSYSGKVSEFYVRCIKHR